MKNTVKKTVITFLLLFSVGLLIFCPIFTMIVKLNDGITSAVCNVSLFTAFTHSKVVIEDFVFTFRVIEWGTVLIVFAQIIGLICVNVKKGYVAGLMLIVISWILLLTSSLVFISVQSDLFKSYGSFQKQGISVYAIITMAFEMALIIFDGFIHFKKFTEKE